jgi:hypothetical protein
VTRVIGLEGPPGSERGRSAPNSWTGAAARTGELELTARVPGRDSIVDLGSELGDWSQARSDGFTPDGARHFLARCGWIPPMFGDDRHALIGAASVDLACARVAHRARVEYLERLDQQRCVPPLGAEQIAELDAIHGSAVEWREQEASR